MTTNAVSLIGCGLYSIRDAARILRVAPRSLRRWADGYTYRLPVAHASLGTGRDGGPQVQASLGVADGLPRHSRSDRDQERTRFSPSVVQPALPVLGGERVLTFADMMELRFVSWFRQHGVSLRVIRAAAGIAAELFEADHPFASAKFATDGLRIFALLAQRRADLSISPALLAQELPSCQYVFTQMVEPYFRDIDFGDQWANRWWPLGREKRVVLDPTRSFGEPIDSATGVPTRSLYRTYIAEGDVDRVAWWYDVPALAVERAIQYEQSLLP